ncbi:hypothetical protein GQ42DRAFT_75291 [Ramicandelaber brevisporus]|nr:hypothetical protein GQ42DRAFT_75291 [Ramicandelaber brevisporus]
MTDQTSRQRPRQHKPQAQQQPQQQQRRRSSQQSQQQQQQQQQPQAHHQLDLLTEPAGQYLSVEHPFRPLTSAGNKLVNPVDALVSWLRRSLTQYPTVTLMGVEDGLPQMLSAIHIGIHVDEFAILTELETFSIEASRGNYRASMKVRLSRSAKLAPLPAPLATATTATTAATATAQSSSAKLMTAKA